jgi:hypothetical protein
MFAPAIFIIGHIGPPAGCVAGAGAGGGALEVDCDLL